MPGSVSRVSSEEVDELLKTTLPDQIENLAKLIGWGQTMVDANLEGKLKEHQIFQLLSMRDGRNLPVLHNLMVHNSTSTVKLVKQITNEDQFTELIFMKDGDHQRNSLGMAIQNSQSDVVRCIYRRLNKENLGKLLRHQDDVGETALHCWSKQDNTVSELFEPFAATELLALFAIQNNEGQTVLSLFIHRDARKSFRSLINIFSGRQSELLDLATISDTEGNTSFHYAAGSETSDYLIELFRATLTLKMKKKLSDALEKKNASNEIVKTRSPQHLPFPTNHIIYRWVLDSIKKHQYILFDYPKVLVISNEANREGAKVEAKALINCFQSLGFKVDVKRNRTKREMLDDLKEASKNKTGLIAAIMSHGGLGFIEDNEGQWVLIEDIEKNMTHHDCITPKCLILQCCQGPPTQQPDETTKKTDPNVQRQNETYDAVQIPVAGTETTLSLETAPMSEDTSLEHSYADARATGKKKAPYVPTTRHLCVFMSSIPGQPSERNQFIPSIVEAIKLLEHDQCISEAFTVAAEELHLKVESQIPSCYNLMPQLFCIKNVLPLALKRAGVNDEGVGEITRGAIFNGQDEAQGKAQGWMQSQAQGEAQEGDVGGALGRAIDEAIGGDSYVR